VKGEHDHRKKNLIYNLERSERVHNKYLHKTIENILYSQCVNYSHPNAAVVSFD